MKLNADLLLVVDRGGAYLCLVRKSTLAGGGPLPRNIGYICPRPCTKSVRERAWYIEVPGTSSQRQRAGVTEEVPVQGHAVRTSCARNRSPYRVAAPGGKLRKSRDLETSITNQSVLTGTVCSQLGRCRPGVLRQGGLAIGTRHPGRSCGLESGYCCEVEGVDRGGREPVIT